MSATADRPAAEAPRTEAPSALTRVAGLELLGEASGSGYKDGAALVRRADGQMVQLGPLMYALLEAIDGERDPAALAAAIDRLLGDRALAERLGAAARRRVLEELTWDIAAERFERAYERAIRNKQP